MRNRQNGQFGDGASTAYRPAWLRLSRGMILVQQGGKERARFKLSQLQAGTMRRVGKPLSLVAVDDAKVHILIEDERLAAAVLKLMQPARVRRPARKIWPWTAGLSAAVAGLVVILWLASAYLPQLLAHAVPDRWRDTAGQQHEAQMTHGAKLCAGAAGVAALQLLLQRLADGTPNMPRLQVHVYDLKVLNAYALPGGRIIISKRLILDAKSVDELAGILAHEIGHVASAHPEASLLRHLLLGLVQGAVSASSASGMAISLEELRQSRSEEDAADLYALQMLKAAHVNAMGLRSFFSRMLKRENGTGGNFTVFAEMLSTHPGMETRIEKIQPLPSRYGMLPALPDKAWAELRQICD